MPVSYYDIIEPSQIAVPVSQTDTVQRFGLGLQVRAANFGTGTGTRSNLEGGGIFQYCQGSDVTTAGQFVQIQGNSAVLLAAAASESRFPVGVAAGPLSATNVYGWVQVHGVCDYVLTTNEDHTAGKPFYINAGTAGLVQSTPAAGNNIEGAVNLVAFSSSGATGVGTDLLYSNLTVQLRFPHVLGSSAAV
jgi:hypothetical protein